MVFFYSYKLHKQKLIKQKYQYSFFLLKSLLRDLKKLSKLLKTDYKNNNYLEFFDSDDLIQGDELSALGYPLGQERLKISNGILSGYERYFLQTDAAINEGNSGGPLMKDNKVVGVNARKIKSIIANNIGYAVPIKLFMIMREQYFENKIINRVNLLIKFL